MNKMQYREYLKTPHWQLLRRDRLFLDNYMCVICHAQRNLIVHHLTYKRLYNERITDVITLCDFCHKIEHFYKGDINVIKIIIKSTLKARIMWNMNDIKIYNEYKKHYPDLYDGEYSKYLEKIKRR
jgi:hypothetical protein